MNDRNTEMIKYGSEKIHFKTWSTPGHQWILFPFFRFFHKKMQTFQEVLYNHQMQQQIPYSIFRVTSLSLSFYEWGTARVMRVLCLIIYLLWARHSLMSWVFFAWTTQLCAHIIPFRDKLFFVCSCICTTLVTHHHKILITSLITPQLHHTHNLIHRLVVYCAQGSVMMLMVI